jgi:hypothetical protein
MIGAARAKEATEARARVFRKPCIVFELKAKFEGELVIAWSGRSGERCFCTGRLGKPRMRRETGL